MDAAVRWVDKQSSQRNEGNYKIALKAPDRRPAVRLQQRCPDGEAQKGGRPEAGACELAQETQQRPGGDPETRAWGCVSSS